ncbi:HEAT repeat domain-containing protein [Saccharibacillus sacchari]|uniref:HEAT repeat domain-containing protein n=1 Tax=Saccharibacillus sacchari TaxID=456493 RepID=A0ACC6P7T5_9BACL
MTERRPIAPNDSEQEINRIIAELDELESNREEPDLSRLAVYARHSDSFIRSKVALHLGFHPSEQADRLLLMLLHDREWLVRAEACESLGPSRSPKALERLKQTVEFDPSVIVRVYALLSIGDLAERLYGNPTADRRFVKRILLTHKPLSIKLACDAVLVQWGEPLFLQPLIQALSKRDANIRAATAHRLLELVNPERARIIALGVAKALLFEPPRGIGSTLAEVLDACRDALHPPE